MIPFVGYNNIIKEYDDGTLVRCLGIHVSPYGKYIVV